MILNRCEYITKPTGRQALFRLILNNTGKIPSNSEWIS